MKLIFDFDYTLFSAAKLRKAIEGFYWRQGITPEVFVASMEASRGDGHDWKPEVQIALLRKGFSVDVDACRRGIDDIVKRSSEFFYEDSISFLEEAQKHHQLFLVTYGEDSFQNAKVNAAGISHFFKKIIITQDITKVSALREIMGDEGKNSLFIEDNPLALQEAKRAFSSLTTVRMNRGEGRYTGEPNGEGVDRTISNLKELYAIISNIDGKNPKSKFQITNQIQNPNNKI